MFGGGFAGRSARRARCAARVPPLPHADDDARADGRPQSGDVYAAAARLASRLSPPDPARAFVATAQFQGALALLLRMRDGRHARRRGRAEALVNSLLAVPLNSSSQYLGGILRWLAEAAAAGDSACRQPRRRDRRRRSRVRMTEQSPRHESSGKGSATASISRPRERRAAASACGRSREARRWIWRSIWRRPLDAAAVLGHRRRPAPLTLPRSRRHRAVEVGGRRSCSPSQDARASSEADGFPPGVVPPPDPREGVIRAIDELGRSDQRLESAARRARAMVELVDAADEAAAQALVSLAYAVDLGDPDGAALLPGRRLAPSRFRFRPEGHRPAAACGVDDAASRCLARRSVARRRFAARPRHRAGADRAAAPQLRSRARGADADVERARSVRGRRAG